MKLRRQLLLWIPTVIVMVAGAAIYWLFYDNRMPSDGSYPIDIAAIRAEADRIQGDKPIAIQVETVSHTKVPEIAMAAGTGWDKIDLVRNAYRVVFADRSVMIDTGYDRKTAEATKIDSYDETAWQHILRAMDGAAIIVVTHEHADHIGGLQASPNLAALLQKALLTPEQIAEINPAKHLAWPEGSLQDFKPIIYDRLKAIAPGMVLIKAAGHTPGSQMIYVKRADGQEYIFMGDTASLADNVRLMRIRSHLLTDFLLPTHDDRRSVLLQTRALNRLAVAEPAIALVPGHDGPTTAEFEKRGLLVAGFGD
jgi:glyoxylase-like metal-dependent hydrolase (beta-lactamase superfamily II)